MFKKHSIVVVEEELKKLINGALRFLLKQEDFHSEITLMKYEHFDRPVQIMDLFDVFYNDVYCVVSGDAPMDLPHIDRDCSKAEDAQIQTYSYIFTGDLDSQLHLAPVIYRGKKGIMLHKLEWHKSFPKGESSYTGFVKPVFVAFEEDGDSKLGLHYLWSLMDSAYQDNDEYFYLSENNLSGRW